MTDGYETLEFDLPRALLSQIVDMLDRMSFAELGRASRLQGVEDQPGVYVLSSKSSKEMLYIGKTEGTKGLRSRLDRHARKLEGRLNIKPKDIQFRAIRVLVFNAMDLEALLIKRFGRSGGLPWNRSGFGSNDPGKERDTTTYKNVSFDFVYPIDLDSAFVDMDLGSSPVPVSEAMQRLKSGLPYLLRFERPRSNSTTSFHADFLSSTVLLAGLNLTTRQVLERCMNALPTGWHATALPSHIICYKHDDRSFPSGTRIAVSP